MFRFGCSGSVVLGMVVVKFIQSYVKHVHTRPQIFGYNFEKEKQKNMKFVIIKCKLIYL